MARNDTYQTKVIPVVEPMGCRKFGNETDAYSVNLFVDKIQTGAEQREAYAKRWGAQQYQILTTSTAIRGFFEWRDRNVIIVVTGNDINIYNSFGSLNTTITGAFAGGISGNLIGFTVWKDPTTNQETVVMADGSILGLITQALTWYTSSTIAGVVGAFDPNIIAYDEYIIVIKLNTGDAYNSDTPGLGATFSGLNFTAGAFITSEITGNVVNRLGKINNYFVTLGTQSIEYFYDVGLAPPGTPFQRIDTFVKYAGYTGGLQQYGNSLLFVGAEVGDIVDVLQLDNFKIQSIATPEIKRRLTQTVKRGNLLTTALITLNGRTCYVIDDSVTTYYYDLSNKFWGQLAFAQNSRCPIIGSSWDLEYGAGSIFVTSLDYTAMFQFTPFSYVDGVFPGVAPTCTIVTSKQDFGSNNQKFMQSMVLYIDRISYNNDVINWQTSDDDYQTWTTARPVIIDQERPNLQQLGRFRARAIKLTHTGISPIRIWGIETDYNQGST